MRFDRARIVAAVVAALSRLVRMLPNGTPGKTRLGRRLLWFFRGVKPAMLDGWRCRYILPSYVEPIAQHLFTFGAYEKSTAEFIIGCLPKGGTLIDVGANIGALAIPIAKERPDASIICIEADPELHRLLQENIKGNDCIGVQALCYIVGANDQEMVPFYRAPDESFGMGSVGPQFGVAPVYLRQARLDQLLSHAGLKVVDVIKIDVEGAELGVLRGASHMLCSNQPPAIIFEFADWAEGRISGQLPGDAQSFLLAHGYRLFRLEADGSCGPEFTEPRRKGTMMIIGLPPLRPGITYRSSSAGESLRTERKNLLRFGYPTDTAAAEL
jgi:FkbM family methyltransferase